MGNVLGTLFGDIAGAIRAKNDKAGTMKPMQFPAAILNIPEAKDPKLIVRRGEYTPATIDTVTIDHNLGVIPDVVVVFLASLEESATLSGASTNVGGQICYSAEALADGAVGRVYNIMGASTDTKAYSVYDENADVNALGCVRGATPRTFKIGGSTAWPVKVGATYNWVAIGGLKAHPAYLDLRLELDGEGGLIVKGGVSEISQLKIYAKGSELTLTKTVDYVHGGEFRVDISDIAPEVEEYTVSVGMIGDGLEEAYPYRFADPVTGWVLPKARGTCGENVTWVLDNGGTLTIKGSGAMTDYSFAAAKPWESYITEIQAVDVQEGVTSVGAYAFNYYPTAYSNLKSLKTASSVKTIGSDAFDQCSTLTKVNLAEGLENIGQNAFRKTGITSVKIPSSVASIANNAFNNCKSLTSVELCNGVQTLGGNVFNGCSGLTELSIPDSVTAIGMQCFSACTGLTNVAFGSGLETITRYAFSSCTSLNNVVIPDTVTSIGDGAFSNCTGLTRVTIGAGVTSIGTGAFQCSAGTKLKYATFVVTTGWWVSTDSAATSGTAVTVTPTSTAATNLAGTYRTYYWRRS